MPLYGHELSEEWDPITAGQAWVVALDKEFIGRDAIAKVKEQGPRKVLVGMEIDSKRTPRQHAPISAPDGRSIGEVTSGITSPTLGRVIAMGFVEPEFAAEGTALRVALRGADLPAQVVKLPFYKRS
ncbi:MAG: hypothetical protein D6744_12450 [Planctomycetota bacterium]|nr:MAG: hypothetical protein D6744_12450 [Planctomycetota bacterium]